jgi:hypothetical protein
MSFALMAVLKCLETLMIHLTVILSSSSRSSNWPPFQEDESINLNEAALVSRYHESLWWRGNEILHILNPCGLTDGSDWTPSVFCFVLLSIMQYRRTGSTPESVWLWWRNEIPAPVVRPAFYRLGLLPTKITSTYRPAIIVSDSALFLSTL